MKMHSQRLATAVTIAASVVFALPHAVAAQAPLVFGAWSSFEWFLGIGPVEGSGFVLNAAAPTRLRVTDDGYTGDAFDIYVNGNLFASTSSVPGGVFTGAFTGDDAWNDVRLSKSDLLFTAGQYTITLAVRVAGSGFDDGEGFIRADLAPVTPPVTTVPEPRSAVLVALGLLGVAAGRRRQREARRIGSVRICNRINFLTSEATAGDDV